MSDNEQNDYQGNNSSGSSDKSEIDYTYQDQFSESQSDLEKQRNQLQETQNDDDLDVMQGDAQKALNYEQTIFKINQDQPQFKIPNQQRITLNCISKYQYSRIIGLRAKQISKNSPLYIQIETYQNFTNLTPIEIAELEYKEKKLPYSIIRNLPGGYYEQWTLQQLDDLNL